MLQQHTLKRNKSAYKSSKRIARGNSSGHGTTAGRGSKGQLSRTGKKIRPAFEGGQTPFLQKLPKFKGFKRPTYVPTFAVNVLKLNMLDDGATVTTELLAEKGIIDNKNMKVKILGSGELNKKLKVVIPSSKSAAEKIEKAGGSVVVPEKKEKK